MAQTTVPANSKVLIGTFSLDNSGIDETMLRCVGGFSVASDQSAATETQLGAVGMAVVSSAAAAVGITAIPDPIADVIDDLWFFYHSFAQEFNFQSAVGVDADFATWYPFDQHAKRILSEGSVIALVASNAHATHGFRIAFFLRMLAMVRGTR